MDVVACIPPLRQISATAKPASACLRNPMICSSVNLLFLIPPFSGLADSCYFSVVRLEGV